MTEQDVKLLDSQLFKVIASRDFSRDQEERCQQRRNGAKRRWGEHGLICITDHVPG